VRKVCHFSNLVVTCRPIYIYIYIYIYIKFILQPMKFNCVILKRRFDVIDLVCECETLYYTVNEKLHLRLCENKVLNISFEYETVESDG
jgi:hypothetical protein